MSRFGAAGVLLAAIVLFCIAWPALSPHGANDVNLHLSRQGPSFAHPLGTDQLGRDLLSRLAEGGRYSLGISAAALAIIAVIGYVYGAVAGLAGGRLDAVLMRLIDGLLALPRLPVSIVLLVVLNQTAQTVWAVVLALSVVSWMLTARLVRGQVLTLRQTEYVRAARALGARRRWILVRHVLPNTLAILVVAAPRTTGRDRGRSVPLGARPGAEPADAHLGQHCRRGRPLRPRLGRRSPERRYCAVRRLREFARRPLSGGARPAPRKDAGRRLRY